MKGHHTLVAAPDGTVWRNETGNAGLAKGGSGDILAGLTAGLLAAGLKQGRTPEDAAVCAVWLHGAAADRCAKRRSMTAMLPGDLFEDLGWILGELGGKAADRKAADGREVCGKWGLTRYKARPGQLPTV